MEKDFQIIFDQFEMFDDVASSQQFGSTKISTKVSPWDEGGDFLHLQSSAKRPEKRKKKSIKDKQFTICKEFIFKTSQIPEKRAARSKYPVGKTSLNKSLAFGKKENPGLESPKTKFSKMKDTKNKESKSRSKIKKEKCNKSGDSQKDLMINVTSRSATKEKKVKKKAKTRPITPKFLKKEPEKVNTQRYLENKDSAEESVKDDITISVKFKKFLQEKGIIRKKKAKPEAMINKYKEPIIRRLSSNRNILNEHSLKKYKFMSAKNIEKSKRKIAVPDKSPDESNFLVNGNSFLHTPKRKDGRNYNNLSSGSGNILNHKNLVDYEKLYKMSNFCKKASVISQQQYILQTHELDKKSSSVFPSLIKARNDSQDSYENEERTQGIYYENGMKKGFIHKDHKDYNFVLKSKPLSPKDLRQEERKQPSTKVRDNNLKYDKEMIEFMNKEYLNSINKKYCPQIKNNKLEYKMGVDILKKEKILRKKKDISRNNGCVDQRRLAASPELPPIEFSYNSPGKHCMSTEALPKISSKRHLDYPKNSFLKKLTKLNINNNTPRITKLFTGDSP
ncbi:unnamed protein product [Moneuplotes crassus]|uniref:Uncharacterized protein n=1 Tax=Euplotes crassus TaxID=5936 RepID=A0AAD1X0R2_EUPCR|nr:unnamed protein product [Moneuplotes crassus]